MSVQTSLTLDRRESSVFRVWEGGRLHDNQGRTTQAREPQWWEVMEAQKKLLRQNHRISLNRVSIDTHS